MIADAYLRRWEIENAFSNLNNDAELRTQIELLSALRVTVILYGDVCLQRSPSVVCRFIR